MIKARKIIAISGASASGKSLLANTIISELSQEVGADQVVLVREDFYYKNQDHIPEHKRQYINYDHPEALDHQLLAQHLKALRRGQAIDMPQYCYRTHTRKTECIKVEPKTVVIVEGILLLADRRLRDLFDIKLYMDCELDICLLRRMQRDIKQRGRSVESISKQFQETVKPMFVKFIEPSKQYADIIVTRGGKNRGAVNMVKGFITSALAHYQKDDDA